MTGTCRSHQTGPVTTTDAEARVEELWRYPVKSLRGERLTRAELVADGLDGDRGWGIRSSATGRILTARRAPALLMAAAALVDGVPVITLPDGSRCAGPGAATDAALSDWLEQPVSLVAAIGGPGGRAEFFEDATDDSSPAVEWTMPEGRFVDAGPLLLLSTASLRTMADRHPDGSWDVRRFRPNLVLDVPGDGAEEGWPEDGWTGRALRVGGAVVVPTEPCVRCTMVTRAQPGVEADVEIFRALRRHHGATFGMWTDIRTPGRVAVGDSVRAET